MDYLDDTDSEERTVKIHTTVGDLIYAIAEAAQEAVVGEPTLTEEEQNEWTQAVFVNLVSRRQGSIAE